MGWIFDWLSWKKVGAYTSSWQDSAAFDKAQAGS
jgi:hypothetical protein